MGRVLKSFSKKVKLTDTHYYREAYQSYFTSPEWLGVDISEDFAEFLDDKKSMFQFPYFSKIYQLWRVLFLSLAASIRESGFRKAFFSDYMVMDLFVVLFSTLELIPKGLISLVLYPFLPKKNDTDFQSYLAGYFTNFVEEIKGTPFFNHDYVTAIQNLKNKWNESGAEHTWVDWFSYKTIVMQLRAQGFFAHYLKDSDKDEPNTTQILVKCNVENTDSPEAAMAKFKNNLAGIDIKLVNSHGREDIYVKHPKTKEGVTYRSVYARLEAPRYMSFQQAITQLESQGIHLREIAGQEHVMLKCYVKDMHEEQEDAFKRMTNITPLYRYGDAIHPNRATCFFKVPARELAHTIDELNGNENSNTSVKFIHNF